MGSGGQALIAGRFQYEWHDAASQGFRPHGNKPRAFNLGQAVK